MIILNRNSEIPQPLPDGFIVLMDKDPDWTSFDVVAKMRSILRIKKIGHAGTLDPFATGLLILLVGKATKMQDSLMLSDKVYEAEIKLGQRTDSFDKTGQVIAESDKKISHEDILKAVKSFEGESFQLPPMFSAVKKDGKKLYELARKGIEVEREPRKIIIRSINILEYGTGSFKIKVHCSKGTYIRTLADDIGEKLGTYAFLRELRRTAIGEYRVEDSLKISEFLTALQKI